MLEKSIAPIKTWNLIIINYKWFNWDKFVLDFGIWIGPNQAIDFDCQLIPFEKSNNAEICLTMLKKDHFRVIFGWFWLCLPLTNEN